MDFLEKDLEQIVYESDKDTLSERGLHLYGKLMRQVKIGNYGIADLICVSRPSHLKAYGTAFDQNKNIHFKGTIDVIELKKDRISPSTFFQVLNYVKGIQDYLDSRNLGHLYNYNITMIGRDVDLNSSFSYLGDIFYNDFWMTPLDSFPLININLFTYKYTVEGLTFEEVSGYKLKNKGF